MSKEYNGWTNYETWNVNLWLTDDSDSADHCRELVAEGEICEGADRLKEHVEELQPDMEASMFTDLLGAAMGDVNWYEIVEHMREG